jgi:hypothetical protein
VRVTVDYRIEPEWAGRNHRVVCFAGAIGVAFAVGALATGVWYLAPVPIPMVAAFWLIERRTSKVAVFTEGDTLVIRNTLRTHRIDRSEITTIRTGQRFGASLSTFEVQLTDHSCIHCEVMEPGNTFRRRDDTEQCRQDLLAWLGCHH